jgi:Flp pilus assembly protein protease CpaA
VTAAARPVEATLRRPRSRIATAEGLASIVSFGTLLWLGIADAPWADATMKAAFGATLVGLAVSDLRCRRIPNAVVYPALAAALTLPLLPAVGGAGEAFSGTALALGVVLPIYAISRHGLGGGDVKMAALVGAMVGFPTVVDALFVATIAAGAAVTTLVVTGRVQRGDAVPYAPFLALGALVAFG